jgi:hypothetical protein
VHVLSRWNGPTKTSPNSSKESLLIIGTNAKPKTEILNLVVHKALANLGYASFSPMSVTIHYATMELTI